MAIFEIHEGGLREVEMTTFGAEGIYERRHIQALLRDSIDVLGERLLVLAEEFGEWLDSSRRIDLLCLDGNASLVVIELKRTEDGGHMELQAVRYAAMVSTMTLAQAVEVYARHRNRLQPDPEAAKAALLEFLGWEDVDEGKFAQDTRIILAAADFGKELTTAVMWLIERGIDIRCVRLKPYRLDSGVVLLDIQQLIPLPEVASFQTQLGVKRQAERKQQIERHEFRLQFWTGLLDRARDKNPVHANRSPTESTWISGSSGRKGFSYNYVIRQHDVDVAIWIGLGSGKRAENKRAFRALLAQRADIERDFGAPLIWEELPEADGSRIGYEMAGGYRSPQEDWGAIQDRMIDAMLRLDRATRQRIGALAL